MLQLSYSSLCLTLLKLHDGGVHVRPKIRNESLQNQRGCADLTGQALFFLSILAESTR